MYIRNVTLHALGDIDLETSSSVIKWATDRSGMALYGDSSGLRLRDTTQAVFNLWTNKGTGTVSDDPKVRFISNSASGTSREMAAIYCNITDVTHTAEIAGFDFYTIASGASAIRAVLKTGGSDETQFLLRSQNTQSPQLYFQAYNSVSANVNYARFSHVIASSTDGAEAGQMILNLADGVDGSLDQMYRWETGAFKALAAGKDLGASSASQRWEDGYFNGDLYIESAANKVASEYYMSVAAEESAAPNTATNAGNQYSFGNGAVGTNNRYIVMVPAGYTCHAVMLSLKVASFGTNVTIDLAVNGSALGAGYQVILTAANSGTTEFATPYALSDGDGINFRTTTSTGTPTGPCVAAVLLRYTKT
jgi:hypothetical protein